MNQRILHRGPDSTGIFKSKLLRSTIFLGANRLAIQNTSSASNQPLEASGSCLIFNGEITNYKNLNNNGTEHSDTSSLYHFLKEHSTGRLHELVGMFAFVFYDKGEQTLLLARDQHGVKPLYHFEDEKYFIASSEIKGILASGLVEKKLNARQINHYLRFKYCEAPGTFFENIIELLPGTSMKISLESGKKTLSNFKKVSFKTTYSKDELIKNLESPLLNSTALNLSAAVPSGLLLSGGIDSTLLLAMISKLGSGKYPCYIVSTSTNELADSPDFKYALEAAKQFGGEPRVLNVSEDSLFRLPQVIAALDQPIADSASMLTYLISEFASQEVKVLLSGAGADEYFAGYNRHKAFYYYLKYIHSNRLAKTLLAAVPNPSKTFGRSLNAKFTILNKFKSSIEDDPFATFMNFQSMNFLPNFNHDETLVKEKWTLETSFPSALNFDRARYLRSDVLALTDVMSMGQSIEVRVPFLDQNLTNFAETIQEDELIKGGRKWMLKTLLKNYNVSDAFINRPKYGFGLPFGDWIRKKELTDLLAPLMDQKMLLFEYVEYHQVQKILHEHRSYKTNWATEIWALITLQIWLDQNF